VKAWPASIAGTHEALGNVEQIDSTDCCVGGDGGELNPCACARGDGDKSKDIGTSVGDSAMGVVSSAFLFLGAESFAPCGRPGFRFGAAATPFSLSSSVAISESLQCGRVVDDHVTRFQMSLIVLLAILYLLARTLGDGPESARNMPVSGHRLGRRR